MNVRFRVLIVCLLLLLAVGLCRAAQPGDMVLVKGGSFVNRTSGFYGRGVTVSDFYIGRFEVTQKQWTEVMGTNPSQFKGDTLPVEMVSWYDAIEYCNKRSEREGLQPYYSIDRTKLDAGNLPDPQLGRLDTLRYTVTIHAGANGYRLPTEAEWEYAAGGGEQSQSFRYSGSNDLNDVGWYWRNSGDRALSGPWLWQAVQANQDRTHPVGGKMPNELGLYDMSGDVREWCWDWYGPLPSHATNPQGSPKGSARVWKGGGWMGADFACALAFRGSLAANGRGPDQGFRVAKNA